MDSLCEKKIIINKVPEYLKQIKILGRQEENLYENLKNHEIKNIKKNLEYIYNYNEKLKNIGTIEDYINYCNEIFPNSEIKNILRHGSPSLKVNKEGFKIKKGFYESSNIKGQKGIYFYFDRKNAEFYKNEYDYGNSGKKIIKSGIIYGVKVDVNNISYEYGRIKTYGENTKHIETQTFDFNHKDNINYDCATNYTEIVVKNIRNIHILGNDYDIDKFKKWKKHQTCLTI